MMEDNTVAKLIVSSILGEEVIELEPKPQERTTEKKKDKNKKDNNIEETSLTVYRLDFSARIKTPEGIKLIIIELQKASLPDDIMRFRNYLGKQYCDATNSIIDENGKVEPIPIYAIYILGKDLEICDTPVLCVNPEVIDLATMQVVEKKSEFLEMLFHKCRVVQISCLKQRRRNELEQLLSVFDQSNQTSDIHILNVREENFPEKYRPVIRRLKMAASSTAVKRQMEEEDDIVRYIKDVERGGYYKGLKEGQKKEHKKMKKEMDKALKKIDEKEKTIEAKDKTIEAKEKALEAKEKALEVEREKNKANNLEIEKLKKLIKNK